MSTKELLLREIEGTPHVLLGEVLDFIQFLKQSKDLDKFEITMASESSLQKDWLRPEEDEARRDL